MNRKEWRVVREALVRGEKIAPIPEKFDGKFQVDETSGCWTWTGSHNEGGYGLICIGRRLFRAHRVSYQVHVGPIAAGLVIDHLCRNRACCNPAHLEPVTSQENIRRGVKPVSAQSLKTHCPKGHPYSGSNLYLHPSKAGRSCLACRREHNRNYAARCRRAAKLAGMTWAPQSARVG